MYNISEISRIFELQKQNKFINNSSTCKERIAKLKRLLSGILNNMDDLKTALYEDLKKPHAEILLTEVYPVISEIKNAIRNLKKWMKPKYVVPGLAFAGSHNKIAYRPKGVCLIISPWNFPFQLSMCPLVSAISAGNSIILKPSEFSIHTTAFIKKLINSIFRDDDVAVVEGDSEVSQALLELPFDHIFFTGSTKVGKLVMSAASKNLTTITLELGGKSPVIIDTTANIDEAARKISWGKFMNCGQTCVAPDYILIHEDLHDDFIKSIKKYIIKFYGPLQDIEKNSDYGRIINNLHFHRIKGLFDDCVIKGAKVEFRGIFNEQDNYVGPTILSNVLLSSEIMHQEIFGPILPVLTYKNLSEVVPIINNNPNPLALYIFSNSKKNIKAVMDNVNAGGILINDVVVHFSNIKLPFGGVSESGIGKTHGFYGFKAFSNETSIMVQPRNTAMNMIYPPYTPRVMRLIKFLIKYF